MGSCPYCLSDKCEGRCGPHPSGYKACFYCGAEGCEKGCPGTFDVFTEPACDTCPAEDYLAISRIMASAVESLEADLADCKATLKAVLDHIKWDSIPQALVDDIDAIFDGNVDDEADD